MNLLNYIVVLCGVAMLASCGSSGSSQRLPDPTPAVNISAVKAGVSQVEREAIAARKELSLARFEADKAIEEAKEAKGLVEKMSEAQSPFAREVEALRWGYESRISSVSRRMTEMDSLLIKQAQALRDALWAIDEAAVASALSEREKAELRVVASEAIEREAAEKKRADTLQEWKDKNMFYKRWFWWSIAGGVFFVLLILGGVVLKFYIAPPSFVSSLASSVLRRS